MNDEFDSMCTYLEGKLRPAKILIAWNRVKKRFMTFDGDTTVSIDTYTLPEFYAKYGYIIKDSPFHAIYSAAVLGDRSES